MLKEKNSRCIYIHSTSSNHEYILENLIFFGPINVKNINYSLLNLILKEGVL